ncbi:MAG: hypothetical protein QOK15_3487 [Nocardioidaceae bacterium]|nr:hypothetical protein [Nocardioidaceae bacterium]
MQVRGRRLVPLFVATLIWGAGLAAPLSSADAASGAAPSPCTSSQLAVHFGTSDSGAGTTFHRIRFRNTGSSACTLDGYPRLVFLNAAGDRIGFPAKHIRADHQPVTIRPDRVGVAVLGIPSYQNFPRARCHPRRASQLAVRAPGTTGRHVLTLHVTVCTTKFGRSTSLPVKHRY